MTAAPAPSALDLAPIRKRLEAATPGPWGWYGNLTGPYIHLESRASMRPIVMDFARWAWQSATPRFQEDGIMEPASKWFVRPQAHNPWMVTGVDHPDAVFIAAARTDVPALIAEVERLRTELDDTQGRLMDMALAIELGEKP